MRYIFHTTPPNTQENSSVINSTARIDRYFMSSGQVPALLSMSGVDESTYQLAVAQMTAVSTTPAWQFYMAGLERIAAIIFHISASYLMAR